MRRNCVCRSMKHSVAKFFGIADEDEEKRKRSLEKWKANTRRLQNRSFLMSRAGPQRKTTPRSASSAARPTTAMRPTSAAEFEMTRRSIQGTTDSALTSQQLLSSGGYDSTDSGVTLASTQKSLQPPHPLDPQAVPTTYVIVYCSFTHLPIWSNAYDVNLL